MRLQLFFVAVLFGLVAEITGQKSKERGRRGKICRYRKGVWSECNEAQNVQTRTLTLKKGDQDKCESTKTETRPCKIKKTRKQPKRSKGKRQSKKGVCKYNRGDWSNCDPITHMKSRVLTLIDGDGTVCNTTKVVTRRCKRQQKQRRPQKQKTTKCKYTKGEWSECDALHDIMTKYMTLKSGDPSVCPDTYQLSKKCRQGSVCIYQKARWTKCNKLTNSQSKIVTLDPASPKHCNATLTFSRKCQGRKAQTKGMKQKKKRACKYLKGEWSECNAENVKTRTGTLKPGQATTCEATKTYTKKCKINCKYTRGSWSDCDSTSNAKTRTDALKPDSEKGCPPTRNKTRTCKRQPSKKCKYSKGTWSECNAQKKRVLTKTLESGDPDKCAATKTKEKDCYNKNGQEKCFYGDWSEFGPCQNGVKTKTRPIVSGGDKCQRKAAKVRPCRQ